MKNHTPEIAEFVNSLRKLADWVESSDPRLNIFRPGITLNVFSRTKEEFSDKARIFGTADKISDDSYFMLRKDFGADVKVDLNIRHDIICERILVETKVTPAHIIPAQPETFVPEHIEEKYEWRCPESILAAETEVAK